MNPSNTERFPTSEDDLPQLALVVGDPQRVLHAVEMLEDPYEIWQVRDYLAWGGTYQGQRVLVASHGLGASSASLVFEQLFRRGVRITLRAGTCGALQPDLRAGMLVIASGAIRDDGVSEQVLPLAVPAVADMDLVLSLQNQAAMQGMEVATGLVWSAGVFYESPYVPAQIETWTGCGTLAVEMEMALLYIMARRYQVRAAGVLAVEGGADQELDPWNRPPDAAANRSMVQTMLRLSLNTLVQAG